MSDASEVVSPDTVSTAIFVGVANARRRGDPWKSLAEEHLGDVEVFLKRCSQLSAEMIPAYAAVANEIDVIEKKLLTSLEQLGEGLWEMRGNRSQDPLLSVLTPGTPSYFFEWEVGQPSDRVEAIMQFLEPYLPTEGSAHEAAVEIRNLLPEYQASCERARIIEAKIDVFEKMQKSFARLGHVQYSRLRRRMKGDGFDPDEIRKVFPDIPGKATSLTFV